MGTDDYHPGTLYGKKELEKIIWEKLKMLPEEARSVFVLREVEGMTYAEIAECLGWPLGTVQTRIHRARLELRGELRKLRGMEEG